MDAVRRLMGLDPFAGLCPAAPGQGPRAGAARHLAALEAEIDWCFYMASASSSPRSGEAFAQQVPEHERDDLLGAYQRRLSNPEAEIALGCRQGLEPLRRLMPAPAAPQDDTVAGFESDAVAPGGPPGSHYFAAQAFLSPGQLLAGAAAIRHLPCRIVHGHYDVICPVRQAYALHEAWPGSQLHTDS